MIKINIGVCLCMLFAPCGAPTRTWVVSRLDNMGIIRPESTDSMAFIIAPSFVCVDN